MKCDELTQFNIRYEENGELHFAMLYNKKQVDEAIAELKDKIESLENLAKSSSRDFACDYNELKVEIFKLQKENAELREASRWRNFKDEPPEHHQWIEACYCKDMIRDRTPRIEIRRWDEGMKYDVFEQELFVGWRPLPSAPKEVK